MTDTQNDILIDMLYNDQESFERELLRLPDIEKQSLTCYIINLLMMYYDYILVKGLQLIQCNH